MINRKAIIRWVIDGRSAILAAVVSPVAVSLISRILEPGMGINELILMGHGVALLLFTGLYTDLRIQQERQKKIEKSQFNFGEISLMLVN